MNPHTLMILQHQFNQTKQHTGPPTPPLFFPLGPGGVESESGSRLGEGRRRCRQAAWDEGWRGHFKIPVGMVVRGGRRQYSRHFDVFAFLVF